MKVFISHSSRDKWVARKLSEELKDLGATTFLDEKDITTGESIDDAVNTNLKDCDELLVLLSPSSIKSTWVLIEVGGAKALDKRLIPILFHVGTNDIPDPISKHLARDINDIDLYYAELKGRMKSSTKKRRVRPSKRSTKNKKAKAKAFKVGDAIVVTRTRPPEDSREDVSWIHPNMNEYLGVSSVVTGMGLINRSAFLECDDGEWHWAFEWLEADTLQVDGKDKASGD